MILTCSVQFQIIDITPKMSPMVIPQAFLEKIRHAHRYAMPICESLGNLDVADIYSFRIFRSLRVQRNQTQRS